VLLRSASTDLLPGNEAPALRAGWHPVAAAGEVGQAPLTVLLQGRRHLLARGADGRVRCSGVRVQQRHGLVWLAPTDPDPQALELPEATDPAWCGGWLGPLRVGAPASAVLAAQLAGPGDGDLLVSPTGLRVAWVEPFDAHDDPGVALGLRPRSQTRRVAVTVGLPLQVVVRVSHGDGGGRTTLCYALQAEGAATTRVRVLVLRRDPEGFPGYAADGLAAALVAERRLLVEQLAGLDQRDGPPAGGAALLALGRLFVGSGDGSAPKD